MRMNEAGANFITGLVCAAIVGLLAGCSGSSSGPSPTATATATASATPSPSAAPTSTPSPTASPTPVVGPYTTSASGIAIDPVRNLAYVPLTDSPDPVTDDSRIAVVDLNVDPNQANPDVATVVLSHYDTLTSVAIDTQDHLLLVLSGGSGNGGLLDLIDLSTNQVLPGSPYPLPTGADVLDGPPPSYEVVGQVLYDPVGDRAIISTVSDANCTNLTACTGFAIFDIANRKFVTFGDPPGPIIQASASFGFSLNAGAGVVFDASVDDPQGSASVVDLNNAISCTLSDSNLGAVKSDVALDPLTNVDVIGNYDGTATVLNLYGSSFNQSPDCTLQEGGTPPNSVLLADLPPYTAGVAVNATTHQAFTVEDTDNGISLITLPQEPATQFDQHTIPLPVPTSYVSFEPFGIDWETESLPYAVAIDPQRNFAYLLEDKSQYFLAQIDLTQFQNNPLEISNPLPSGTCFGLEQFASYSCNNGSGVVFFPLPPAFGN
jgi:hypothetical protein